MKTFAEIYDSMKDTLEYQVEELALAFTESVLLRMEELNDLKGKDLAERMGTSEAYASKLLKGKGNFTLETLVKLARALECHIEPPALIPLQKAQPAAQVIPFVKSPKIAIANFRAHAVSKQMTVESKDDLTTAAAA